MSTLADSDLPDSPEFFNNAAPATPASPIAATAAMPRACAREMGDYSEGCYTEAVKTRQAPTMEDSEFADLIQSRAR